MPSNAEYTKQAEELAEGLGLEISTEGLNNEKLAALVSDLKAKKKDADNQAAEEAAAKAAAELEEKAKEDSAAAAMKAKQDAEKVKAEKAAKKPPFYVMPGKAITSKRGVLSDGDEIKVDDLAGGKEALEAFVKSGHVGKGE